MIDMAELARSSTHSILIAHGIPVGREGPSIDAMAGVALKRDWHVDIQHDASGWYALVRDALDRAAVRTWIGAGASKAEAIADALTQALASAPERRHG